MMKFSLILFFSCLGIFCLVLCSEEQSRKCDPVREDPGDRQAERISPISRWLSKIVSYFKSEESISKNIPPGVIPDPLGNKNFDNSSKVDPYGLTGTR